MNVKTSITLGWGIVLATASSSTLAFAQGASAPEEGPATSAPAETTPEASEPAAMAPSDESAPVEGSRKMDFSTPTPQPAEGRSGYSHNGFYFRAAVGPGWQWVNVNDRSSNDFDLSGNAFGMGANILVGASPSPGIALGGGVLTHFAFDVNLEHDDVDAEESGVGYLIVGPFFDAYPDYKEGWHLGGEIGFAYTGLENIDALVSKAYGAGVAGWLGYDWWVAPEWSAGLNLQLAGAYAFGSNDGNDGRITNVSTTLFITALYH